MSPMDGARRQLLASFLAMEAPSLVVKLSRDVGNGFIADGVQAFFYNSCLNNSVVRKFPPSKWYLSRVLKQIILAAESDGQEVLDGLYEQQITLLNTSKKSVLHEMGSFEEDAERCYKSYLYSVPDDAIANMADCLGKVHASKFRDMILTIRVSSNMLEGSTGWSLSLGVFACLSCHLFRTVLFRDWCRCWFEQYLLGSTTCIKGYSNRWESFNDGQLKAQFFHKWDIVG